MPTPSRASRPRLRAAALAIAASTWLATPSLARAERADRDKPINVEADAMHYDDIRQVNVFSGNVTLTKGTIVIRGDRLVMREDPEGYQYGTAEGQPASFRQKRDGLDQFIVAVGRRLNYDGKTETVRIEDRATLKRLEGERVMDEVHGNLIVYESRTEFFRVEGGGTASASPENPTGRVRVVIQPRNAPPEPSAPSALTPERRLTPRGN